MTNLPPQAVLMCDTQPVAVEGVRGLLERCPDLRLSGAVHSLPAALEVARTMVPTIVVLDKAFGLPSITDWLHTATRLGLASGSVVWGTGITESEALKMLQAGAKGVVRRSAQPETFLACLRAVAAGNTWMEDGIFGDAGQVMRPRESHLTPRERQVAELVEKGLRNRDIARSLGIRTGTVKIHLKHIFEKTGVRGRYGLALTGLREKGAITLVA